ADVYLLILDNDLYEVTGGQPTPGSGHTDFAALARAAGISRVYSFDTLEAWRGGAPEALTGPGPVVVWLKVEGRRGQKTPKAPRPMAEQIERLRQAPGWSRSGPVRGGRALSLDHSHRSHSRHPP